MSPRSILSLCATLLAAVAVAAPAQAATSMESIMQDDRILQNFGLRAQALALDEMQVLGVDTIHAVVNWNSLAPDPDSTTVPPGIDFTDPRSYNPDRWNTVDQLVRGAELRGIDVILSPAAPAPSWAARSCSASERRRAPEGTCRPNARLYGQFVTALAKRYSGTYIDEDEPAGVPIPRVSRWSFWNEPNLNAWIYPSIISVRGDRVPISAKLYRDLVYSGGNALRRNGHSRDQILLGETAPVGVGISRTSPVDFYEALFCLNSSGKRMRRTGAISRTLGCNKPFRRLPVNAVAHHPYTKGATARLTARESSDDVPISNVGALVKVLRQGARARAITSSTAKRIYFTEFGVSSSPPARPRRYGVSLSKQAEYINQFEFMSYSNRYVRGVSQFQLEDDRFAGGATSGRLVFQTGLRFSAPTATPEEPVFGRPKPSYAAYKMPIWVVDRGRTFTIWGGLRHADTGRVQILNRGRRIKTVRLRRGYFSTHISRRSGTFQLRHVGDDVTTVSRVARPVKPGR